MEAAEKHDVPRHYGISETIRTRAYIKGKEAYEMLYRRSVDDPEGFWGGIAREYVTWFKEWDKVEEYNFDIRRGPVFARYFANAKVNVSYNCLDRHLQNRGRRLHCIGRQ